MAKALLPDDLWALIQPLLPAQVPSPKADVLALTSVPPLSASRSSSRPNSTDHGKVGC